MKVFFVGAGPGDPELLTVRAQKLLSKARLCVYAGSLVNPQILGVLPAEAERIDSAGLDLEALTAIFARARDEGTDVLRLHTGDPALYGAIGEQMVRLQALGIDYEVVPGVSAFQAAAAALCVELTAPETAQTVILTRAAGRTPMPESESLADLARHHSTLCLFLSTQSLPTVVETLTPHYGADCPAAVVYRASWPDQTILRGTLADIAAQAQAAGLRRTAMVMVGRALGGATAESRLYSPTFSHGYREGASD